MRKKYLVFCSFLLILVKQAVKFDKLKLLTSFPSWMFFMQLLALIRPSFEIPKNGMYIRCADLNINKYKSTFAVEFLWVDL